MRKEYKRSLIKFSNYSLCVTLPKSMLNKLDLDKGDEVIISMKRGKIILEPDRELSEGSGSKSSNKKGDSWEPMPEISREEDKE
jgi:bifunctional DNA-binding transcriptional regulator/antitoxin component of YhaV-PrlF toxin-antitoxin module